jgi:hypothetical protein
MKVSCVNLKYEWREICKWMVFFYNAYCMEKRYFPYCMEKMGRPVCSMRFKSACRCFSKKGQISMFKTHTANWTSHLLHTMWKISLLHTICIRLYSLQLTCSLFHTNIDLQTNTQKTKDVEFIDGSKECY